MVNLTEKSNDNDISNVSANDSVNEAGALNESAHDPYYPPIISLPEVNVPSGEDEEEEIFKIRSKLFRFDSTASPPEWKERGTGDVRLLQHKETKIIRVLMRREKTLRLCANHFIRPWMILKQMKGSDRAWIWQVHADFADEEAKSEVLAIRFSNAENASKFKTAFDSSVISVTEVEAKNITLAEEQSTPTDEPNQHLKENPSNKDTKGISKSDENNIASKTDEECSQKVTDDLKNLTVQEK